MLTLSDSLLHQEPHIRRTGTVAIVTHCKGRRFQLEVSLPAAMAQELPYGYCIGGCVVVDFGCPDDTVGWVAANVEALRSPQQFVGVAAVRDDTRVYQICRARNVGLQEAFRLGADFAMLIDCDIQLHPGALAKYIERFEQITSDEQRTGVVGSTFPDTAEDGSLVEGLISACLIHRSAFYALRGYDESHVGYGHCDTNFYERVKRAGIPFAAVPMEWIHLWIDDASRDQYLAAPRTREHIQANARWAFDFERPVNPDGYGEYRGFFIRKEPR